VSVVHQDENDKGDAIWETLQKGKEPRVKIIVKAAKGKVAIGKLMVKELHISTLINGKRVGPPPPKEKAA
jgi:hypothetical protein